MKRVNSHTWDSFLLSCQAVLLVANALWLRKKQIQQQATRKSKVIFEHQPTNCWYWCCCLILWSLIRSCPLTSLLILHLLLSTFSHSLRSNVDSFYAYSSLFHPTLSLSLFPVKSNFASFAHALSLPVWSHLRATRLASCCWCFDGCCCWVDDERLNNSRHKKIVDWST